MESILSCNGYRLPKDMQLLCSYTAADCTIPEGQVSATRSIKPLIEDLKLAQKGHTNKKNRPPTASSIFTNYYMYFKKLKKLWITPFKKHV